MNIKLGSREIIVCAAGAVAFVVSAVLKNAIFPFGTTSNMGDYFNISLGILAAVAAIFGPICGGVVGFGGTMLADVMLSDTIYMVDVLPACIYGVLIGLFAGKFLALEGDFHIRQFVDYICVAAFAGIFNWVMICPLASFIMMHSNLFTVIERGSKIFVGATVSAAVLGGAAMLITSKIMHRKNSRERYFDRRDAAAGR